MTVKIRPQVFVDANGDTVKERSLIGFALNQRNILKNLMSFNKLNQDARKIELADGSKITVMSCFGIDKIWISCPKVTIAPKQKITGATLLITLSNAINDNRSILAWDLVENTFDFTALEDFTSGTSFPFVYSVGAYDKIRPWKLDRVTTIYGIINSATNIGTTGQRIVCKSTTTLPIQFGATINQTGYHGEFNCRIKVGDFIKNTTAMTPSAFIGMEEWAQVTAVVDQLTLEIDKRLFIANANFAVGPSMPIFRKAYNESFGIGTLAYTSFDLYATCSTGAKVGRYGYTPTDANGSTYNYLTSIGGSLSPDPNKGTSEHWWETYCHPTTHYAAWFAEHIMQRSYNKESVIPANNSSTEWIDTDNLQEYTRDTCVDNTYEEVYTTEYAITTPIGEVAYTYNGIDSTPVGSQTVGLLFGRMTRDSFCQVYIYPDYANNTLCQSYSPGVEDAVYDMALYSPVPQTRTPELEDAIKSMLSLYNASDGYSSNLRTVVAAEIYRKVL